VNHAVKRDALGLANVFRFCFQRYNVKVVCGSIEFEGNLIRFPRDSPVTPWVLVKWLYGFMLQDHHLSIGNLTNFADDFIVYDRRSRGGEVM